MKKRCKQRGEGIGVYIGVLIVGVLLALGCSGTRVHTQSEEVRLMKQAITKAIVQCYAMEGVYPPSMEYISKHYGVKVDEEKYIVHYEIFASNIMPEVTVIPKQWGDAYE